MVQAILGIEYNLRSRRLIYMKEQLARLYRDRLVNLIRRFESPTINVTDMQVTGITFGPRKPKETLYGTTVTMQFRFRGGTEWEK